MELEGFSFSVVVESCRTSQRHSLFGYQVSERSASIMEEMGGKHAEHSIARADCIDSTNTHCHLYKAHAIVILGELCSDSTKVQKVGLDNS